MKQQKLLVIVTLASLAAACGGDEESSTTTATAAATASSSSSTSTSSTSSTASSSSSAATSSTSSSAASSSSSSSTSTTTSSPGTSSDQSGTAAALGEPTAAIFNGLATILDKSARTPGHAVPAAAGTLPSALAAEGLPYIPSVKALVRRDALILYFPNVAGAADYRAYAVNNNVSFVSSTNGKQPRGAVIACAGFRQHTYQSELKNGYHTRELLQAIELPGFVTAGNYTVILEATTSPCPFPGMYAHTDAQITMRASGSTNWFHAADPSYYKYTGIPVAVLKSFETMKSQYGNEIINGQGSVDAWPNRLTAANLGAAVPAGNTTFPSDPRVIARTPITVQLPFYDETVNAPIFDVGANAIFDDFDTNAIAAPSSMTQNPDYASYNSFSINPLFKLNGKWQFWGRFMQAADSVIGTQGGNTWSTQALLGTQAFTRHGRLYTTFGDAGADVGGTLNFSSLEAPVVEMDSQKYIHSIFRLNSDATHRRYWYWVMCGGATRGELFDDAKGEYKLRPLVFETTFNSGGNNPSVPDGHTLESSSTADDAVGVAKECLTITQKGRPENPFSTDGSAQTSGSLRALIHPANKSHGIIALGDNLSDKDVTNGNTSRGFRFKVDASGNRVGPVVDPFDQLQPLVHYDVFVRPDRLVVFVNGRIGFCVDLSDIKLSMKYAMIGYGDLLYHSSAEWQEMASSATNPGAQTYQHQMNTPIATSRVWDVVGHSDKIDIPSQFSTFDPALCRKPSNQTVVGN